MGLVSRLMGKKPARPDVYHGPEGRRIYAIGDIHGRVDLLADLMSLIAHDRKANDKPADLIFLGDYVDRGDNSAEVIDLCIEVREKAKSDPTIGNVVFLKGNHEEAMQSFLEDGAKGAAWLSYGGMATVMSYRAKGPANPLSQSDYQKLSDELAKVVPDAHVEFLNGLLPYYQAGDFFFVHAAVHPKLSLADQPTKCLYWGEESFLSRPWREPYFVVHGHTIMPKPDQQPFRLGIDTGAYYSGKLTAVCIDGDEMHFISTGADGCDA